MTGQGADHAENSRLANSARLAVDNEGAADASPLALDPVKTAVVVTDMINHQLDPARGMLAALTAQGVDISYFVNRVEQTVIPNHRRLLEAARACSATVVFTVIGSARADYSDLNPNVRDIGRWGARLQHVAEEVLALYTESCVSTEEAVAALL